MAKTKTINVKGTEIAIFQNEQSDYISLTVLPGIKIWREQIQSFKIGLGTEIQLSCLVFGSNYIILILTPSNSMGLKNKLV
jgi:hypothetical protein